MAYRTMPAYNIEGSVGVGGSNRLDDTKLVQAMLVEIGRLSPGWQPGVPLMVTGHPSPTLGDWIKAFQKRLRDRNPGDRYVLDGRVDPMPMQQRHDYSSSIGGAQSTMYQLNAQLFRLSPQTHLHLAEKLGIPTT